MAYIFALPPTMKEGIIFHIALLKSYINDTNHVVDWSIV